MCSRAFQPISCKYPFIEHFLKLTVVFYIAQCIFNASQALTAFSMEKHSFI